MDNREQEWFSTKKKTQKQGKEKSRVSFLSKNKKDKPEKVNAKKGFSIKSALRKGFGSIKRLIDEKPLIKKIFYTLTLILIFRIATTITTPGIHVDKAFGSDPNSFVGIMDMMGGGALKNFSIVALGISPYITASIIMTLLQSEVFPPIYRLARSGPQGKRKINIITRSITLAFAIVQAITIIQQLSGGLVTLAHPFDQTAYKFVALPIILLAGSLFTLFLGEEITKKGVGNGTSLIIFSGIASTLPTKFKVAYDQLVVGNEDKSSFVGLMEFLLYLMLFFVLIYIIGYLYKAERHVPIQQTGAGMTREGNKISHLPIKINPAGVMPVIFSLSLAILPVTIAQFLDRQDEGRQWIEEHLRLTDPIGLSIMAVLTFAFTIAMSLVTFNPYTVADNFKKNGTFIPGIKPGDETETYLTGIVVRLSIFSAFYLTIISSIQYFEQMMKLNRQMTFGGTTLIILVTVGVETLGQLKARDQTIKISKAKQRTLSKEAGGSTTGGLLW